MFTVSFRDSNNVYHIALVCDDPFAAVSYCLFLANRFFVSDTRIETKEI